MEVVFSNDAPISSNPNRVTAVYSNSLQTLFYQIQHLFTSPNALPGEYSLGVGKTFNLMNHSEVDMMIANWRAYPHDGLDAISAERKSLELLRGSLSNLFHFRGDLDGARDALL